MTQNRRNKLNLIFLPAASLLIFITEVIFDIQSLKKKPENFYEFFKIQRRVILIFIGVSFRTLAHPFARGKLKNSAFPHYKITYK